jgi:hypothetical protein
MTDTTMNIYGTGCLCCGKRMADVTSSVAQAIAYVSLTYQASISPNNNDGTIDVKPRSPRFFLPGDQGSMAKLLLLNDMGEKSR